MLGVQVPVVALRVWSTCGVPVTVGGVLLVTTSCSTGAVWTEVAVPGASLPRDAVTRTEMPCPMSPETGW